MEGERLKVYSEEGLSKMTWRKLEEKRPALSWFKVLHKIRKSASNLAMVIIFSLLQTTFDAPEGDKTVAIRMNKMGKGMIWINGENIGRYWVSFLSPLGQPTQIE